VAGDAQLASLIALDAGRPHLLLDATPARTPWLTTTKFNETGGGRGSGAHPTPWARRRPTSRSDFPGLVPEVPRAFEWLVTGRQPLLRIGWAIVRPKTPVSTQPFQDEESLHLLQRFCDRAQILPGHALVGRRTQQVGRMEGWRSRGSPAYRCRSRTNAHGFS